MLRRKRTLALAGSMAVISAFGLGAGLIGIGPILDTLLTGELSQKLFMARCGPVQAAQNALERELLRGKDPFN